MDRRVHAKGLWCAALLAAALPVAAAAQSEPGSSSFEIVVRALSLLGTPYRYGGRTPTGFDCSGFVGYVFTETTGVTLPRRSEELGQIGEARGQRDLAPGDLVFFNTLGRRFSHVGIYIGDGRFVHAPARRGRVRVDRLADPYWSARYNGARELSVYAATGMASATAATIPAAGAWVEERVTP